MYKTEIIPSQWVLLKRESKWMGEENKLRIHDTEDIGRIDEEALSIHIKEVCNNSEIEGYEVVSMTSITSSYHNETYGSERGYYTGGVIILFHKKNG